MNHSHIKCKITESLHLSKFSIQAFDVKLNCEECGVEYQPLHNFCIISRCGEEKRCCFVCNWESVPCKPCRENKIGRIIVDKTKNTCEGCSEEKKVFKMIEEKKKKKTFKTQ